MVDDLDHSSFDFEFDFEFDSIVEFVNSSFFQLKVFDLNTRYHDSHLDVLNYIQAFAKSRDYAVRIRRTKRHKKSKSNQYGVMYVMCFKRGKIVFFVINKRKRIVSRMIECSFSVVIREKNDVWSTKVVCEDHNHEGVHVKVHSFQRKIEMTFEVKERIKTIMRFDRSLKNLFDELRSENFDCIIDIKDIYNVRNELKVEMLKNLTFTQALLMVLKDRKR